MICCDEFSEQHCKYAVTRILPHTKPHHRIIPHKYRAQPFSTWRTVRKEGGPHRNRWAHARMLNNDIAHTFNEDALSQRRHQRRRRWAPVRRMCWKLLQSVVYEGMMGSTDRPSDRPSDRHGNHHKTTTQHSNYCYVIRTTTTIYCSFVYQAPAHRIFYTSTEFALGGKRHVRHVRHARKSPMWNITGDWYG